MNTVHTELTKFLINDFFPDYVIKHHENIFKITKTEFENYHFVYYIFDFEYFEHVFQTETDNNSNVTDCEEIYLFIKELYLKNFSFETLIQDVCSKQYKYKSLYPLVKRGSLTIKYSKTYQNYLCTLDINFIKFIKKSHNHRRASLINLPKQWDINTYLIQKKTSKLFSLNNNNKVLMYFGFNNMPKYISLKNASSYIKRNPEFKQLIQKLFNIHLNNQMLIPEETVFINNKFIFGKNSLNDAILYYYPNITPNIIADFTPEQIVNTLCLLEKKEINDFIIFYNKNYSNLTVFKDVFEKLQLYLYSDDHNRFLIFLFFYILIKKKIVNYSFGKIYYSHLNISFIKDIYSYFFENYKKDKTINLNFNFNNDIKYLIYKNDLKKKIQNANIGKPNSYMDKFLKTYNNLKEISKHSIKPIINNRDLYNWFINENIFYNINSESFFGLWFSSIIDNHKILFSISFDSKYQLYVLKEMFISNNFSSNTLVLEIKLIVNKINEKNEKKFSKLKRMKKNSQPKEIELPF